MKRKILKSIANIVLTLLVIMCFTLATRLQDTFALEVIGGEYGLRVELSQENVATNNLNPGDEKESYMTVSNDGEHPLPVYLNNRTVREIQGKGGGNLNDKLKLIITNQNDEVVYSGSVKGLETPQYIGEIQPNNNIKLDFKVELPDEDTTNEYQAASITVKWIVSTSYTPPSDPPRPRPRPRPNPPTIIETEEIEEIEEEDIPEGEPEVEEPEIIEEELEEEEIPLGIGTLPKTGELTPTFFYGLGTLLLIIGIFINKKPKSKA
ncbi:LPXTG cell wall anchor domain-containing protein [Alkaliphilus pronyensis]|uniref:LPXTG cell wall anchor domain-containing protein n=1 Tax=Alkaliphilus pronyensis TaxID=1482732 RepID=A0A6I0F2Z1_9FIRM|nr:LPXTG cell wall anchor domain-containing protein [Alkaliphilus pronyensis]KAB3532741.1 LPXTG cell wall anchor domain-containing protein [Alkaliphilus pronyensis]